MRILILNNLALTILKLKKEPLNDNIEVLKLKNFAD